VGQFEYGAPHSVQRKYSPGQCTGTREATITGNPDPAHISTRYAERQNLTTRMAIRRFEDIAGLLD
jgi:hypothetical protein